MSSGSNDVVTLRRLMYLAVFKSSLNYWENAYVDSLNPWHNYLYSGLPTDSKSVLQWIKNKLTRPQYIALCDAAGALYGAAVCSPGGPWCMLGGALTGGAVQSGLAAIRTKKNN